MYFAERRAAGEYTALLAKMSDTFLACGLASSSPDCPVHDTISRMGTLIASRFRSDNLHVSCRTGTAVTSLSDQSARDVVTAVRDLSHLVQESHGAVLGACATLGERLSAGTAATAALESRIALMEQRLASLTIAPLVPAPNSGPASPAGGTRLTPTRELKARDGRTGLGSVPRSPRVGVPSHAEAVSTAIGAPATSAEINVATPVEPRRPTMASFLRAQASVAGPSPEADLSGTLATAFYGDFMQQGSMPVLKKQDRSRATAICELFGSMATPEEAALLRSREASSSTERKAVLKRLHDLVVDFIAKQYSSNNLAVPKAIKERQALKMSSIETRQTDFKGRGLELVLSPEAVRAYRDNPSAPVRAQPSRLPGRVKQINVSADSGEAHSSTVDEASAVNVGVSTSSSPPASGTAVTSGATGSNVAAAAAALTEHMSTVQPTNDSGSPAQLAGTKRPISALSGALWTFFSNSSVPPS